MSKYYETAAQQVQNRMVGEIFFLGENGQKMQVISPLHKDDGVIWFITHDPENGQKFRNEIRIFEI